MAESNPEITINSAGVIIAFLFEFFLPLISIFIWIRIYKGQIKSFLYGLLGFIVSVALESLFLACISLVLDKNSNIFYTIAGICPGLFEETGRYLLLKYLFSTNKQKSVSVSYGIGHGGMESMMMGINLLMFLFLKDQLIAKGAIKENITLFICLMSSFERLSAFILHISLSVIVYKAIKENKFFFYILAIIIHDVIDLFPLLKLKGIITSIVLIELIVFFYSLFFAFFAYKLYNIFDEKEGKLNSDEEEELSAE